MCIKRNRTLNRNKNLNNKFFKENKKDLKRVLDKENLSTMIECTARMAVDS